MLILGRVGKVVHEDFTVTDSSNNRVPGIDTTAFTSLIFDNSGTDVTGLVSPTFTELGSGHYRLSFVPNGVGTWYPTAVHPLYFPWSKTGSLQVFANDFDTIAVIIERILGLVQENFFIDQTTFDENGCMITGRIRTYDNAADVGTGSGVIETYCIEASYDAEGRMETYKVITC